ncbi:MAG: hypothetical protein ACRDPR_06585, partial [Nocardioidaceae bacterium]
VRGDGRIETIAGTGRFGYSGDGGPAVDADVGDLQGLAVSREGTIYVADRAHHVVRRVNAQGVVSTFAGTGRAGDSGELGPPARALLARPQDVAVATDGAVYVADSGNGQVRLATAALPGFEDVELTLPSSNGRELYLFTAEGRHLRTIDSLTGAVVYRFEYDGAGRLTKVVDGDGETTEIVRDPAGVPTKVVASGGQETVLTLDGNGYLKTVANPLSGEIVQLETLPSGLLSSYTDPAGGVARFFYDSRGRLIRDENAGDGFTTLARTEAGGMTIVTATSAVGRTTQYVTQRLSDGSTRRDTIDPAGVRTETVSRPDGTTVAVAPDGTQVTYATGPDPRWGMLAPLVES